MEELADNRRHTVEMARTIGPAEIRADAFDRDRAGKAIRIHRVYGGRPQQGDAFGFQHRTVFDQLAGIGVQILAFAELGRVHENGYGHEVGMAFRLAHQRQVAFMQRAHSGDQSERLAAFPEASDGISQHFQRRDGLHGFQPSGKTLCT